MKYTEFLPIIHTHTHNLFLLVKENFFNINLKTVLFAHARLFLFCLGGMYE